jgi:hypothetical protein
MSNAPSTITPPVSRSAALAVATADEVDACRQVLEDFNRRVQDLATVLRG